MAVTVSSLGIGESVGADGNDIANKVRVYKCSLSPVSRVIAVTVLLTGAIPAELETVTVMVYLLPGSSPVIV